MRRFLFAFAVLAACQMTAPDQSPTGVGADAIAVSTLADAPPPAATAAMATGIEAPPVVVGGKTIPHPKPRPATPVAETPVAETPTAQTPAVQTPKPDPVPEVAKSPEQRICEKSGAQWATAGETGASLCVKRTRDNGKACRKKGDCQGECLARSGTCSPITPLIGCNDILEADGRMVTLCLN